RCLSYRLLGGLHDRGRRCRGGLNILPASPQVAPAVTTHDLRDSPRNGFTVVLTVARTPAEVYSAIIDPRAWWSRGIVGHTSQVGDEFDYRYLDVHWCRIRIVEAVPDRRVTWHVVDNTFSFLDDDSEWVGTDATFDITADPDGTRLVFTHHGLVPEWA